MVTLSCEQRQKEIAIRKVNGAQVCHILRMFFQEYLLLMTISAVVVISDRICGDESLDRELCKTGNNGWLDIYKYFCCRSSHHFTLYHWTSVESGATESGRSNQKRIIK